MAIEDFFNHTCNIYHITSDEKSPGYGLPGTPSYSYPLTPSLSGVSCHFSVANATSVSLVQNEPQADYNARVKVAFPIGTDIKLNDRIVHLETGLEYLVEIPNNIRNHHIAVFATRNKKLAPL